MKISGEDAFQAMLEGRVRRVPARLSALGAVASALAPHERQGPDPRFQRRFRSELLAAASVTPAELFDASLERDPADERVRPLVSVAAALGSMESRATELDPRFRFALRNRLVDLATNGGAGSKIALASRTQRTHRSGFRIAIGMGAAATMLFGATLASAQTALPGDLTYGVKLAQERVAIWPTSGANTGLRKLDYSRRRLTEVRGLTERGDHRRPLYTTTLDRMDTLTIDGANLILREFTADRRNTRSAVERLSAFALAQASDLTSLLDRLPPEVRPAARDSLGLAESTASRADAALEGCGACAASVPNAASADAPTLEDGSAGPCRACGTTGETSDPEFTGGTSPSSGGPAQDPDDGRDGSSSGPTPSEDDTEPAVDLPPVEGTSVDEQVEEEVDKLLDDLGIDPLLGSSPVPSLTPDPTAPVTAPSIPTVVLPPVPTLPQVRVGGGLG